MYKGLFATIPSSWAQSLKVEHQENRGKQKHLNCDMGFQEKPQYMKSSREEAPKTKGSRCGWGCRSGTPFGASQGSSFKIWNSLFGPRQCPLAVCQGHPGSLAGFQEGTRLPPWPIKPFSFLIYVQHSEWSKPKASLIKDESEETFEVMWYISHYGRRRRLIVLEDKPFSWSYSGLTVSWGWNKRSITSCDLCRKFWWNTSC